MKISRLLTSLMLSLTLILGSGWVYPQEVMAKNIFREIVRGIKRGVRFVVNLPDKATRWMGPVLGPIAADMLTGNISRSARFGRIFSHAQRADRIIKDIDEQRRLVNELRTAYREEAVNLQNFAGQLRDHRESLGQELVSGNLSLAEYQERVISLDRMAESYEQTAQRFEDKAEKINEGTIVRILTNNATNVALGRVKDAVVFELENEVNRYLRLDVINRLTDSSGMTPDKLLDMLVSGDIDRLLGGGGFEDIDTDALRERVRERIKDVLREEKENLKNNWKEKMNEIIKQMAGEIREEKKQQKEDATSLTPAEEPSDAEKEDLLASPEDEDDDGCPNGYDWRPNSGVGCVQTDCLSVANAKYDYTGRCSCGSAGSINENPNDPNRVCTYSSDYKACPGCLHTCVHYNEECPKME